MNSFVQKINKDYLHCMKQNQIIIFSKKHKVKFHSRGVAASWLDRQLTFFKDVYR